LGIKAITVNYIRNREFHQLAGLVRKNKRAVKYIYSLLYTDQIEKWYAVEAFGYLAKKFAREDIQFYRDIIRRLLWMMNDEGGNSNWSAPETIGEIIYNQPELFGDLAPMMISAALEEDFFHRGMLWAVNRFGHLLPHEVEKFSDELIDFLTSEDPEKRGLAASAVGSIGLKQAKDWLNKLVDDKEVIKIYNNGAYRYYMIGNLARSAIESLT
jgi:hypothetical protein